MIVLRTKFVDAPDSYAGPMLVIARCADGYVVSRVNAGAGASVEVCTGDIEPWGKTVYYWSMYGEGFVAATGREDSRDQDAFLRARFGCTEGPVFVAARGGADELVIVVLKPAHTTLDYTRHSIPGPTEEAVESFIPGYLTSSGVTRSRAKRDLLRYVNPVDLLAEVEKQIDLISMLIVDLVEKQPGSERPEWWLAFKDMLEQHSATQFKGAAGALADVVSRKARMRALQRTYFSQRRGGAT